MCNNDVCNTINNSIQLSNSVSKYVSAICNIGSWNTVNELSQLTNVCLLCVITVYDIPITFLKLLIYFFETQIKHFNTNSW